MCRRPLQHLRGPRYGCRRPRWPRHTSSWQLPAHPPLPLERPSRLARRNRASACHLLNRWPSSHPNRLHPFRAAWKRPPQRLLPPSLGQQMMPLGYPWRPHGPSRRRSGRRHRPAPSAAAVILHRRCLLVTALRPCWRGPPRRSRRPCHRQRLRTQHQGQAGAARSTRRQTGCRRTSRRRSEHSGMLAITSCKQEVRRGQ